MPKLAMTELTALVKLHFSHLVIDSEDFNSIILRNHEGVVARFEAFFASMATSGTRLTNGDMKKAFSKVHRGDPVKIEQISIKLVKALSFLQGKIPHYTDGSRMEPCVARILKLMKKGTPSETAASSSASLPVQDSQSVSGTVAAVVPDADDNLKRATDLWSSMDMTPCKKPRLADLWASPNIVQASPETVTSSPGQKVGLWGCEQTSCTVRTFLRRSPQILEPGKTHAGAHPPRTF